MTLNMLRRHLTPSAALAFVILAFSSAASRADLLVTCGGLDDLVTCAATDVGKECQGGGKCFEMYCENSPGTPQMAVYKCFACPTIVGSPDGGACLPVGSACGGDGGTATCGVVNSLCLSPSATNKYLCQTPAAAQPTGPPTSGAGGAAGTSSAGAAGSGGSSGCDIAPKPPKPETIGLGLLGLGVVLFAVDKLRRRSR
jgi:hypothetical protein